MSVVGNPFVVGLPDWSAVCNTGCWPNGTPLVASPGCVVQINWVTEPAVLIRDQNDTWRCSRINIPVKVSVSKRVGSVEARIRSMVNEPLVLRDS